MTIKCVAPIAKIKNNLRSIHRHCPYRKKAKERSKIDASLYKCEGSDCNIACYEGESEKNYLKLVQKYADKYEVIWSKIEMDHISPVVDIKKGFTNFDDYIRSLWVSEEGYNCLCYECHQIKTSEEAKLRGESGSLKRKK